MLWWKRKAKPISSLSPAEFVQWLAQQVADGHEQLQKAKVQCGNLDRMVTDTEQRLRNLQQKVNLAREHGDEERAEKLASETAAYETTLASIKQSRQDALETLELMKTAQARLEESLERSRAEVAAQAEIDL